MKTDLYTKAVLTVIAISLAGIAIQLTTKEAHAQSGLRFTPSGSLIVTICNASPPSYGSFRCAEVDKLER
jgi:hypothetical protein